MKFSILVLTLVLFVKFSFNARLRVTNKFMNSLHNHALTQLSFEPMPLTLGYKASFGHILSPEKEIPKKHIYNNKVNSSINEPKKD
jgi:hypothetical protein